MINPEQAARFAMLEQAAPQLRSAFAALTSAHVYFQGAGGLRTLSVSDVLDNGSIEATFQGVRIKFEPLLVFGSEGSARGRVVCIQCHCTYGEARQDVLGSFTFGSDGQTDLPPDAAGAYPNLHRHAPAIVLHFLDAALRANNTI